MVLVPGHTLAVSVSCVSQNWFAVKGAHRALCALCARPVRRVGYFVQGHCGSG